MTLRKEPSLDNEQSLALTLALDDASALLLQVGGKGASLARLAAAGLPVPSWDPTLRRLLTIYVEENRLTRSDLVCDS